METFLAIDCGNTRIKATLFRGAEVAERVGFEADAADDFIGYVESCVADCGAMLVSGRLDARLAESVRMAVGERFLLVTPHTAMPIGIDYGCPETLGLDRKATAAGAAAQWPGETLLVVDAGTALTLDLVGKDRFLGGNISPGLEMRFGALEHFTSALPRGEVSDAISYSGSVEPFGKDTLGAIACGVVNGFLDEIAATARRAGRMGATRIVLTGGDSALIMDRAREDIKMNHEPDLLAKGLRAIFIHHEENENHEN